MPRSTALEEEIVDFPILDINTEQEEEEVNEEVEEEIEEEVQFLYTCLRFVPYPTPSLSPLTALLTATIQQASQLPENQLPENQ